MLSFSLDHLDERTTAVRVDGEIDIATAPALRTFLATALRSDADHTNFIVDLCSVPFVDSSGVGVLINSYKLSRSRGTRLALAGCTTNVHRVLLMMGLLSVLNCHASVEDAQKSFLA